MPEAVAVFPEVSYPTKVAAGETNGVSTPQRDAKSSFFILFLWLRRAGQAQSLLMVNRILLAFRHVGSEWPGADPAEVLNARRSDLGKQAETHSRFHFLEGSKIHDGILPQASRKATGIL